MNQDHLKPDPKYTLRLEGKIRFGTYRGCIVKDVIEKDLEYMKWYIKHFIHPIESKVIKYIKTIEKQQ
jgi:hypothetical protein